MARLHCVFDKTSKEFIAGGFDGTIPIDPATHVVVVLSDYPDRRTERWDGASGVRPATSQELSDFDDNKLNAEASRDVDTNKALRALVVWLAEKFVIPPSQARDEIITKYKALL